MNLTIIKSLSKSDLKTLINQLETGIQDLLKSGDIPKAKKLQNLVGNCIDLYNIDNPEYKNFFQ